MLVDTRANAILDLHVMTTRRHDSQIAPSLSNRNADTVAILRVDEGYGDQKSRSLAHENGIRPLIKHPEFSPLQKAWNAQLDAHLYGQRCQNETVKSRINGNMAAFVRSRHWWKQFHGLVVSCLSHSSDKTL